MCDPLVSVSIYTWLVYTNAQCRQPLGAELTLLISFRIFLLAGFLDPICSSLPRPNHCIGNWALRWEIGLEVPALNQEEDRLETILCRGRKALVLVGLLYSLITHNNSPQEARNKIQAWLNGTVQELT